MDNNEEVKQNEDETLTAIGEAFYRGIGVKVDYKEAFQYFQKAASMGNVRAKTCLGRCYELGRGTKRSYETALDCYEDASAQGNILATLKIGLDILTQTEQVAIDRLYGHGGFFKTPEVGQRLLSAAVGAPVSVMETAGEGGPYGMALLAAYMLWKDEGETLPDYLDNKVFAGASSVTLMADEHDIAGFDAFLARYRAALPLERAAAELVG